MANLRTFEDVQRLFAEMTGDEKHEESSTASRS
jgi:hypothetical protein